MGMSFSISEEKDGVISMVEDFDFLSIDLSNSNGGMLLEAMGIEYDYCGSIEGDKIIDVLMRLNDLALSSKTMHNYDVFRMGQISTLLFLAKNTGNSISWG